MNRMMAELFGKIDGYCKGKGGSMHLAVAENNVLGSIGIVGSNMSLAVGAGMAAKKNKKGQVAVCFFGDGAANRGTFHESMNISSILNLPIIYVLENNFYAISECSKDMTNIEKFSIRAQGYGVPGYTIDGNDPWAVYEASKNAIELARAGKGPTLLEFVTWRHYGHYEGDPDSRQWIYRCKEEHEKWMKKDPIPNTRKKLLDEGIANEKELVAIEEAVNSAVEAAVQFAHESPWPDVRETYTDVYAD
jgi:pyruvate dehydrogenase E1 component alpha subunit